MTTLIIRDDDPSFFTHPGLLDTIYAPLWERGLPVSLSVIPAQTGATRVLWREGAPYDPSIPPGYRGDETERPLADNAEMCAYLNGRAREGLVEICLHGWSHSYREYGALDGPTAHEKLQRGLDALQHALPDATVRTFIAPYDKISTEALQEVFALGLTICTNTENLATLPDLADMQPYQRRQIAPEQWLYTCDEYLFTHHDDPDESYTKALDRLAKAEVMIVANHYWTFFHDWQPTPNAAMLRRWHDFVADALRHPGVQVGTFA
ncbi:MAG: DUF2334 domain-containing protein [Anaerolineae bacterium]|nr:DUF2334 domain-containing protein [Anaerolineae bacterium]